MDCAVYRSRSPSSATPSLAGCSPSSLRLYFGVALPWLLGGTMPRPSRVGASGARVDLVYGVSLDEILRGIADIADDAEVRLQDRVAVAVGRVEAELIRIRRAPLCHVIARCHADFVEHVVIEVVLVGTDARFFVRIHRESSREIWPAISLRDERIDVGRVRRVVQRDERRVHMTRRSGGRWNRHQSRRGSQPQHTSEFLHLTYLMSGVMERFPSEAPRARKVAA